MTSRWIHHHFTSAFCAFMLTVIFGFGASGCTPSGRFGHPVFQRDLETATWKAINAEREKHQLPPLSLDWTLTRIARNHTEYMLKNERFEHRGRHGSLVEGRFDRQNINWVDAGENVARNKGYADTVAEAVRGWLASPDHRENILAKRYQETGIGIAYDRVSGYYYFTQVFLRRMPD